ncbi:MAG: hypothetical protein JSS98_02125 [Bacteroidetes bacterium]|nr:hypothetical protein [Bacteroidota bacterium]
MIEKDKLILEEFTPNTRRNFPLALWQYIQTNWPIYLTSLFCMICLGIYFIVITPVSYHINGMVLVTENKNVGKVESSEVLENDFVVTAPNTVENTIQMFRGSDLAYATVKRLRSNIKIFTPYFSFKKEVDPLLLPISLSLIDDTINLIHPVQLRLTLQTPGSFSLKTDDLTEQHKTGDTLKIQDISVIVSPREIAVDYPKELIVMIYDLNYASNMFRKSISISPSSKTSSTIDFTLIDNIPKRGERTLNTFLQLYNEREKNEKNHLKDSVLRFLDSRIALVTDELDTIENEITNFRTNNEITDLPFQSKEIAGNSFSAEDNRRKQELHLRIVELILSDLKDPTREQNTITALDIPDETLRLLIVDYNKLQQSKLNLTKTVAQNSIEMRGIDNQISKLKTDIIQSLTLLKKSLELKIEEAKDLENRLQKEQGNFPKNEKKILEFSRQQAIRQELYLYLLKKKEAVAVSRSLYIEDLKIVDSAKADYSSGQPKKSIILLSAGTLAFAIAFLLVYIKEHLNQKLKNAEQVKELIPNKFIGEIATGPIKSKGIITANPKAPFTEQFRKILSNIHYCELSQKSGEGGRVILVTSSIRGEGKSFVSLNLANVACLSGKKAILVELDLRRPILSNYAEVNATPGIVEYLQAQQSLEDIIQTIPNSNGLKFIAAGAIPEDPLSILQLKPLITLIAKLKEYFEVIIIDSPPAGLVGDSQAISKFADATVFVIRDGVTTQTQLRKFDETTLHLKSINILYNGAKTNKKNSYGYGYS